MFQSAGGKRITRHSSKPLGPLRFKADLRSLFFLSALLALFAAQWSGIARGPALWSATCILVFVGCIIKHNHMHTPMFSSELLNRGLNFALSVATGTTATGIISSHNIAHHGGINTDRDYVRTGLVRTPVNFINLILFPFASALMLFRRPPGDLARWRTCKPALYWQAVTERVFLLSFFLPVLYLDCESTLRFLVAPWLFGQWCILAINLLQHQDCETGDEFNNSRNITGRFINWIFLNNGYHTAHHLKPGLHWSLLPEYHNREVRPYMDPRLERSSLTMSIWERFLTPSEWRRTTP